MRMGGRVEEGWGKDEVRMGEDGVRMGGRVK